MNGETENFEYDEEMIKDAKNYAAFLAKSDEKFKVGG